MTLRITTFAASLLLLCLGLVPADAQTPEERAPTERGAPEVRRTPDERRAPGERRGRDSNRPAGETRQGEQRRAERRRSTEPTPGGGETPAAPNRGSDGSASPTEPGPGPGTTPGETGGAPEPGPGTPAEAPVSPAEPPVVGETDPPPGAADAEGAAGGIDDHATDSPAEAPAAGAERPRDGAPREGSELPRLPTERGSAEAPSAARADPVTPVRVSPAAVPQKRARKWPLLAQRQAWEQMFHRTPLGFERATPAHAYYDALSTFRAVSADPAIVARWLGALGWPFLVGLLLLSVGILAGLAVERRRPPRWRALWSRLRAIGGSGGLSRLLVLVARRAAVPVTAWLFWSVGGLLAEEAGNAFVLVQQLLTVWLLYRVADAVLCRVTAGWRRVHAGGGLFCPLHRLLLFAAWWLAGWMAMDTTAYREDVRALWVSVGHLILVIGVFSVLVRKEQVLGLLPHLHNRPYQRFLAMLSTAYLPLVYASLVVALLWVAGYQRLAETFLGRGWAVLAAILVAFIGLHFAQEVAQRGLWEDAERKAAREAVLTWTERLMTLVVVAMVLSFSLHVLGLWEPWRYLLELTWIELGKIRITGQAIWASLWIAALGVLLSGWLQALLAYRIYPQVGIDAGEAYALNRLLHYAMIAGAILLVLNNLGLSPQSLALVAGGLSVGIGLGLQNLAGNLASGLILLSSRQIRQGDIITIGEHTGTVKEVNLRSTVVTNWDNVDVLVPNSKLLDDTLVNWTHSDAVVRATLPFGVAYSANPRDIQELALQIARENPSVLPEPEPQVWFEAMGSSSLDFKLLVWINMLESVKPVVITELYCRLFEELKAREIEIPFPQQDLHLRSGVPWDELIRAFGSRDGADSPSPAENGHTAPKGARTGEPTAG